MELVLKQNSLKCLIRCINFNLGANRVIRNILLTMSKFRLPGTIIRDDVRGPLTISDRLIIYFR